MVTEFQDRNVRSVRTQVFLPLFSVAEWLAQNWWFLQAEAERPGNGINTSFDRRHNLRWAREGFALPSLRLVTLGQLTELRWEPLEIPKAGISFLARGRAVLSSADVSAAIHEFVTAVVARLDDSDVLRTSLHDEWTAVQNADEHEREFCLAAARLGEDPYSLKTPLETKILEVAKDIRPELLNDFLSVAQINELTEQGAALARASESIASDSEAVDALRGIRAYVPAIENSKNAWENGYRFAQVLRAKLNGGRWKSRSLDDLAGYLRIDQIDHCLLKSDNDCRFLDALTGVNQRNNPKFLIEKERPDARQFAFCRALFASLTSCPQFAAVSKVQTVQQQMNRAFAAELLAPHDLIKRDLSSSEIGEDEVDDLAADYGVSSFVIRHQIENHRIARVCS
ncbi:MAG: hypothetical protein R3C59_26330 [Planctomycetaceae bacterium]